MKRALIHKPTNRLCQVEPVGGDFPVHPDLEWRDCADDIRPDTHDFDGAAFVLKPPPPPPTPEELERAARKAALDAEAAADVFIDRLRSATPDQIKTYVQNNVTDFASARVFIGKLACAVAYALHGGAAK